VTFLNDDADPGTPPRVAYAVGRRSGGAVARNRIRRRLRAVLAQLAGSSDSPLRPGAYLVGASSAAADLPFSQLRDHVATAVRQATAPGGR
jgi:ribonuclease P protein component